MRIGRWVIGLVVLLLGALWFTRSEEAEVERPAGLPTTSAPREALAPLVVTPTALVETSAEAEEPVEPQPQTTSVPKCRPNFLRGEGPPLELTFTGAALPDAPPKSFKLEVRWTENDQPRRWFHSLSRWTANFWPCGESEVSVNRGPYRLRSTRVPRAGAVTLFLEKASSPSEVTVRTVRRGAPVMGVRVSLTGCDPVVTGDGGVAVTSCEEMNAPRQAVVRAPWRSATRLPFAPDATEVTLSVLGRDEVEPGRVGVGFAGDTTRPVVTVITDGGPAHRLGMRVGDEVLEVDGIGVSTVEETMPRIIGTPGTTVRFKLRRDQDVLLLDVVRQPQ